MPYESQKFIRFKKGRLKVQRFLKTDSEGIKKDSFVGDAVRLYGSSRLVKDVNGKYYIETGNIILLDGERID